MITGRQPFYAPSTILNEVKRRVDAARFKNDRCDYLSFVPDGEPTLDSELGSEISLLKRINIPIAVFTNASLIACNDVKSDLLGADLISLKVDVVSENLWREINRPHKEFRLDTILEGITEFVKEFEGVLLTETMLIDGVEYGDEFEEIADFLGQLERLDKAYIAIPTRPPAENWVRPVKEETLSEAFHVFSSTLGRNSVEYLIDYEGNKFASTGRIEDDLLGITAVHPMRREAVEEFLMNASADWGVMESLMREREIVELHYEGETFYMRRLPKT